MLTGRRHPFYEPPGALHVPAAQRQRRNYPASLIAFFVLSRPGEMPDGSRSRIRRDAGRAPPRAGRSGAARRRGGRPPAPRRRARRSLRVHAAAITRGELPWPVDRVPAIPSRELSRASIEDAGTGRRPASPPATRCSRSRRSTATASPPTTRRSPPSCSSPGRGRSGAAESAAIPLPALTAWQGLFDHGAARPPASAC